MGYYFNGTYQSCITPIRPRSYITGSVFGLLVGTTFITQLLALDSSKAAANLAFQTKYLNFSFKKRNFVRFNEEEDDYPPYPAFMSNTLRIFISFILKTLVYPSMTAFQNFASALYNALLDTSESVFILKSLFGGVWRREGQLVTLPPSPFSGRRAMHFFISTFLRKIKRNHFAYSNFLQNRVAKKREIRRML